jgi:hypothetical protein
MLSRLACSENGSLRHTSVTIHWTVGTCPSGRRRRSYKIWIEARCTRIHREIWPEIPKNIDSVE